VASLQGGGISINGTSSAIIVNSILWGDSAPVDSEISGAPASFDVTYSDIEGGWAGTGNIDEDPLFVGGGDYHLTSGSLCIDAGTNVHPVVVIPLDDIDGDVRPYGAGHDMGADEYVPGEDDCTNGLDDDGDTLFDCEDPDCRTDADGDTYLGPPCDSDDCDDTDGTIWQTPPEVGMLLWASKTDLEWEDVKPAAGSATTYDILQGALDELPVGGVSENCLGTAPNNSFTDPTVVIGGDYYYLVRGSNGCPVGDGTYGFSTVGERISLACP
jgi:hypothetical protein